MDKSSDQSLAAITKRLERAEKNVIDLKNANDSLFAQLTDTQRMAARADTVVTYIHARENIGNLRWTQCFRQGWG